MSYLQSKTQTFMTSNILTCLNMTKKEKRSRKARARRATAQRENKRKPLREVVAIAFLNCEWQRTKQKHYIQDPQKIKEFYREQVLRTKRLRAESNE